MTNDKKLTSAKPGAEPAATPVSPVPPKSRAKTLPPAAVKPAAEAATPAAPSRPAKKAPVTKAPVAKAPVKQAVKTTNVDMVPGKKSIAMKKKTAAVLAPAAEGKSKAKAKLVRDSFTMPPGDYELIAQLKQRALKLQRTTKKSELLRAGLQALAAMSDQQMLRTLEGLSPVKTGRPMAQQA